MSWRPVLTEPNNSSRKNAGSSRRLKDASGVLIAAERASENRTASNIASGPRGCQLPRAPCGKRLGAVWTEISGAKDRSSVPYHWDLRLSGRTDGEHSATQGQGQSQQSVLHFDTPNYVEAKPRPVAWRESPISSVEVRQTLHGVRENSFRTCSSFREERALDGLDPCYAVR